jgi:hypothetical protein
LIFADTSFLLALFNRRDHHHPRCAEIFEGFAEQRLPELLVTTTHVVFETVTLTRMRVSHSLASYVGERLLSEKMLRIHRTSAEEEWAAFDYFRRHDDQRYSFVDCLSFVVMEKLGIREALTLDTDFAHRFIVRPGPA